MSNGEDTKRLLGSQKLTSEEGSCGIGEGEGESEGHDIEERRSVLVDAERGCT